ncbi:MAG: hypothetical protein LC798_13505 [Chloroflexi bacterium]|nr:hypothetical protein [Chloroflexota bacterium]
MTLEEIVAGLAEHSIEDVVKALPTGTGSVYQSIYKRGYDAARAAMDEKVIAAETRATSAEARVGQLEAERKDQPDVEAIRRQYDEKIEDLQKKHQKEADRQAARLENAEYGTAVSNLEAIMLRKGLKPLYAKVRAKDLRERIRFDKDGKMTVVSKGHDQVPIDVRDGQDPLAALADEAFNEAEADEKAVQVPAGPGVRETNQGAGGGASPYEQAREAVKQKRESRPHSGGWQKAIGRA